MTISTISGARIRRRIRKIVAEACAAEWAATRNGGPADRGGRRRPVPKMFFQKTSSGLLMAASDQPRWNETVSTTSSTTETMLASSAPPDSETTLAVQASFMPAVETYVA